MHLVAILLFTLGATALAQFPVNLSFVELTSQYLPFISLNTAYVANDTLASSQLSNANNDPVTIFLSLDLPFLQFLAEPPSTPAAGQVEQAHYENPQSNADLLQYLQLDGIHMSTSFNGTSFESTRLQNKVSGGAKLKVSRNATSFYIESGLGFVSNVLIPDIAFAHGSGILHIIDHPAAPPYTLSDTAIVLDNHFLIQVTNHLPFLDNTSDVTAFAIQNSALHDSVVQIGQYAVIGEVAYSPDLTVGKTFKTVADGILFIGQDADGGVLVNGSRVVQSDILTDNGVVHVFESAFSSTVGER